ncbi:MAG: transposase, partial [Actinobacteria bacterium]|nr:transposase [Actinomycetota bacterium]
TGSIHVEGSRVKLPRLGWIRLKESDYLPAESEAVHVLSACVSERAGRWFVSLQVEEELHCPERGEEPPLGVDLGVENLAVCSNGEVFENPRALKRSKGKLRRLQKKLSRQEKGSGRREATRKKITRLHYRISCVRSDAIHQATSRVVAKAKPHSQRPCVIGVEDLNVSGMMKNHCLARAVADASMREFRRQLEYKCAWYGIEMVMADPFFPSSRTCSACGAVKPSLELSERVFRCLTCGHVADRDLNAAVNLSKVAGSPPETLNGRGGDVRPAQSSRQTPAKRQLKLVG